MKKKLLILSLGFLLLTACNFKNKGKVEEAPDSTEQLLSDDDTTLTDETAIDDSGEAIADDTIAVTTEDVDIPANIEPE
jgi:hypothetical protein